MYQYNNGNSHASAPYYGAEQAPQAAPAPQAQPGYGHRPSPAAQQLSAMFAAGAASRTQETLAMMGYARQQTGASSETYGMPPAVPGPAHHAGPVPPAAQSGQSFEQVLGAIRAELTHQLNAFSGGMQQELHTLRDEMSRMQHDHRAEMRLCNARIADLTAQRAPRAAPTAHPAGPAPQRGAGVRPTPETTGAAHARDGRAAAAAHEEAAAHAVSLLGNPPPQRRARADSTTPSAHSSDADYAQDEHAGGPADGARRRQPSMAGQNSPAASTQQGLDAGVDAALSNTFAANNSADVVSNAKVQTNIANDGRRQAETLTR